MFVNRIYLGKSLKTSFVSPGKHWNSVYASPGKSSKTVFYRLYEPCTQVFTDQMPFLPPNQQYQSTEGYFGKNMDTETVPRVKQLVTHIKMTNLKFLTADGLTCWHGSAIEFRVKVQLLNSISCKLYTK